MFYDISYRAAQAKCASILKIANQKNLGPAHHGSPWVAADGCTPGFLGSSFL